MRRLLGVGLLIAVVAVALTGCEWLTEFFDQPDVDGDDGGGGTPTGSYAVVSGRIEIHLQGVMEYLDGSTNTETVGETFYTATGTYNAVTKTFTATWDDNEFANTYMEVRLDASEDIVEYFYARQTRTGMFGDTFFVTEITGHGVPYTHGGTSNDIPVDHYTVTGMTANAVIDSISQRIWSTSPDSVGAGTELNPWKLLPAVTNLVDAIDDDIMISLGWQ
jgi:hypothetical protein